MMNHSYCLVLATVYLVSVTSEKLCRPSPNVGWLESVGWLKHNAPLSYHCYIKKGQHNVDWIQYISSDFRAIKHHYKQPFSSIKSGLQHPEIKKKTCLAAATCEFNLLVLRASRYRTSSVSLLSLVLQFRSTSRRGSIQ